MAIIISKGGKNAKKIDKSGFEAERSLQEYIYDNPESIPLSDIKEGVRLLVVAREFPTRSGPIDALGIDKEGDIYCIETKLYKNPDKRLVVAQVLDYGASLWRSVENFAEFTSYLDSHLGKTVGANLTQHVQNFFGFDDDEVAAVLDNVQVNLADGRFKFVVLMDKLHDQLKDLVLFLNKNSRFDLLAVEMEFYRYEDYEILIPKLYGAEVKKDVAVSAVRSQRKKWDEPSFFSDVATGVDGKYIPAIRALYDFSNTNADQIGWGTGGMRGSFNPRFSKVAQRSLFTVWSDGFLRLNLRWLDDNDVTKKYRDEFAKYLSRIQGLDIPDNYHEVFHPVPPEMWCPVVDEIIASVKAVLQR